MPIHDALFPNRGYDVLGWPYPCMDRPKGESSKTIKVRLTPSRLLLVKLIRLHENDRLLISSVVDCTPNRFTRHDNSNAGDTQWLSITTIAARNRKCLLPAHAQHYRTCLHGTRTMHSYIVNPYRNS